MQLHYTNLIMVFAESKIINNSIMVFTESKIINKTTREDDNTLIDDH